MSNRTLLNSAVDSAVYGRFSELRPAQEEAIPLILNAENVMISAGTGSGKTEAVIAPLLSRLWHYAVDVDGPAIIYLSPTKALANDLEHRLSVYCEQLGLRVGIRHGDRDDLVRSRRPHVLITTPESLDVLLQRKDACLATIRAAVVDEVHLLYNNQRGLQLSVLLPRLKRCVGSEIQLCALSATVGDLKWVRDFVFGSTTNSQFISSASTRTIDAVVCHPNDETFISYLEKLVSDSPTKLLVFANSRRECELVAGLARESSILQDHVYAHYSSLSKEVREKVENDFAQADTAVCVATSTLELGIDIGDIDAVLLWGPPPSTESFLQRIGRGCRRTNKTNVICVIRPDAESAAVELLTFAALIDAGRQGELSRRAPYRLYGSLAQQCMSMISEANGAYCRIADMFSMMTNTSVQRAELEEILEGLAAQDYTVKHGYKNSYGAGEKLYLLKDWRLIYGNFPPGSQEIPVMHKKKELGAVPKENLLRVRPGMKVRFAGKPWVVKATNAQQFEVEPAPEGRGTVDFLYGGSGFGTDAFLANRMWQVLCNKGIEAVSIRKNAQADLAEAFAPSRSIDSVFQIPRIDTPGGFVYVTFAGRLLNMAVGAFFGCTVGAASDLTITSERPIDFKHLPDSAGKFDRVLPVLVGRKVGQTIYQQMLPQRLMNEETLQDWLNDESIGTVIDRLRRSTIVSAPSDTWRSLLSFPT